jgi:glycine hydroxymethyltransferase
MMLSAVRRSSLAGRTSATSVARAARVAPRAVMSTQPKRASQEGDLAMLNASLAETDPDLYDIMEHEKRRQRTSLVLIPSENFTSKAVLDALGSVMSNKYSEGYPSARYYGGNEFIDMAEDLCRNRALDAFKADPAKWGVNVQVLSGSPANFCAFSAVCKPHDRIMGLDLPHGGHLSHGFQTETKKVRVFSDTNSRPLCLSTYAASPPPPPLPAPSPAPARCAGVHGVRLLRDFPVPPG